MTLSENAISLMSTLLILIAFCFYEKGFSDAIFSEMYGFLLNFYTMKRKNVKIFCFKLLAPW